MPEGGGHDESEWINYKGCRILWNYSGILSFRFVQNIEASGMMVGKYMTKNHLINQSNQEKPSPP
jgi:hypothetical protein